MADNVPRQHDSDNDLLKKILRVLNEILVALQTP